RVTIYVCRPARLEFGVISSSFCSAHGLRPLQTAAHTPTRTRAHAPVPTMSFHLSAEDIRVDDGHILRARLAAGNGEWRDAEFDLNEVLGNQNGMIHWDGRDFSHSAENITFSLEGGAQVPILRVHLRSDSGEQFSRDVNLAERLGNDGGSFTYRMTCSLPIIDAPSYD
ncbi:Cyanovirin-N, partial [Tolypocladium paradoxum]